MAPDSETINIDDLIELLAIPQVEEHFRNRFEWLKYDEHSKYIRAYREKKEALRQEIFENRRREMEMPGIGAGGELYWFEMVCFNEASCSWRVTKLDPQPLPLCDRSEIIPADVIEYIDESPVDPGELRTLPGVYSAIYGRSYDLVFLRFSRNHAFGTIRESSESRQKRHQERVYTGEEKMDTDYEIFFAYMRRYPEVQEYLFNVFFNIIKPMHDRRFIAG